LLNVVTGGPVIHLCHVEVMWAAFGILGPLNI